MMRTWAAAALLAVAAGCTLPDREEEPFTFDGAGAYAMVEGLLTGEAGEWRPRVVGTPGHGSALEWLWGRVDLPGWDRERQSFTGADYQAIPMPGEVATYTDLCGEEDASQVEGFTFTNVMARHDARGTDDLWILGAHWDSKEEASQDPDPSLRREPVLGANDGASGVGVLLQLMRHVSDGDVEPPVDLLVVFFDGEDGFEDCHPVAGSAWFAHHLEVTGQERFLLLDMVGDLDARFPRESHSVASDPGMVDLLWRLGPALGLAENLADVQRSVVDDHVPLIAAGVPSVDLIDYARPGTAFPPYWHTTGDTLDKLHPRMLGRVGQLVADAMVDDAFSALWQAPPEGA